MRAFPAAAIPGGPLGGKTVHRTVFTAPPRPWRAPLRGALKRVQFRSRRNCREHTFNMARRAKQGYIFVFTPPNGCNGFSCTLGWKLGGVCRNPPNITAGYAHTAR